MKYSLADDAKPQLKLLLIATVITIALWFIPFAEYLVYPIRLFTTFIHESSHALMALLTGGSVSSLTIASDGSGVVYSVPSGFFGQILTASAGYLGTTAFGVFLLYLIRKSFSPNKVLTGLSLYIMAITVVFSIVFSFFNIFSLQVGISSVAFTILAGMSISAALFIAGKYSSIKTANFAVAFLAVQCLFNAFLDLKNLFMINAPLIGSDIKTDAANMANATGLPAIAWVAIWILVSAVMISIGLRLYVIGKKRANHDLPFND